MEMIHIPSRLGGVRLLTVHSSAMLGDNSPWVSCVSACLISETDGLSALEELLKDVCAADKPG